VEKANTEPLVLLQALEEKANNTGINAQNRLDLQHIRLGLGVKSSRECSITGIDSTKSTELVSRLFTGNFDEIWYPSTYDIEIFDESLDWFALLRHVCPATVAPTTTRAIS
jgi:hypothetical protein